jgi:hypothetical protein
MSKRRVINYPIPNTPNLLTSIPVHKNRVENPIHDVPMNFQYNLIE